MKKKQPWKQGMWIMGIVAGIVLSGENVLKIVEAQEETPVIASETRWLEQGAWKAKWSNHQLAFSQTLSVVSVRERSQPLTYRLVNQKGEVLQEHPASITARSDETVQASVTFDLSEWVNETYVYIELTYKGQVQKVKYQAKVPTVFQSGKVFQLATKGEDLMLVNQTRAHYTYQDHAYFAEQLHLEVSETSTWKSYQLRQVGKASETGIVSSSLDEGIDLRFIEEGLYYIYLDQKPVHVSKALNESTTVWQTVTRNGSAKQVRLTVEAGMLALEVTPLEQLPEEVYDILIDPGHGGTDPGAVGNGTTEAIEVLKVSEYLAKRLSDHGLKVKLTRTDLSEPATVASCDYDRCPYMENGRIEQIYATQANYVISNHLNASVDRQSNGSEVYSSVKTSDNWASQVIKAFASVDRTIHDVTASTSRVSAGSYKRALEKTQTDYYYMMRESGGQLTGGTSLQEKNKAYTTMPTYGAETLLVEYAYLDHVGDYQYWSENWQLLGELVVKATVQYLGIPYVSPAILS